MSTRGHVVAVTCLAMEARIALGPGVAVICNHASELVASLEAAAKRGAAGIISFGIAGGLAPHLAAGDWVVGSSVRTKDGRFPTDTESHVAARIAAAHRIPFAACRAVIDPAHSVLPPAAVFGLRHDGTPDVIAVLRSLARQPNQLPALARTALDARIAATALRRGRRLLGAGLGFPYFEELAFDADLAIEMS